MKLVNLMVVIMTSGLLFANCGDDTDSEPSSSQASISSDPLNAVIPQAEICNGLDDDCNGEIDEGQLCGVNQQCLNGRCILANCKPQPETCNGLDDDCNGEIDEGQLCGVNQQCLNGLCILADCKPQPETCNGLDDDCDGEIDEGNDC